MNYDKKNQELIEHTMGLLTEIKAEDLMPPSDSTTPFDPKPLFSKISGGFKKASPYWEVFDNNERWSGWLNMVIRSHKNYDHVFVRIRCNQSEIVIIADEDFPLPKNKSVYETRINVTEAWLNIAGFKEVIAIIMAKLIRYANRENIGDLFTPPSFVS